jgi:hypothetical protein
MKQFLWRWTVLFSATFITHTQLALLLFIFPFQRNQICFRNMNKVPTYVWVLLTQIILAVFREESNLLRWLFIMFPYRGKSKNQLQSHILSGMFWLGGGSAFPSCGGLPVDPPHSSGSKSLIEPINLSLKTQWPTGPHFKHLWYQIFFPTPV